MRLFRALLLTFLALPAAAVVLGPERPITPPAYGPAYGYQSIETLASDGMDFLAVWTEGWPDRRGIYAAVVSETLALRSVPARPIVLGEGIQLVDAVWTGDAYLLSWFQNPNTIVARVSREGVLEGAPVTVAFQSPGLALAWNGRNALLVVGRPDGTKMAMLLDAHGRVVRDDIVIPIRKSMDPVDAAAAGDVFVLAWSDAQWSEATGSIGSIRIMRVSATGEAFAPQDVVTDVRGYVREVLVAGSNSEVGLAYLRDPDAPGAASTLVMQTIDAQVGAASAPVSERVNAFGLQVIATSRGFVAVLLKHDGNPFGLATVTFSGAESAPIAIGPTSGRDLRVATNGNSVVAIWRDHRLSPEGESPKLQIFGAALDAAAERLTSAVEPIAISAVGQGAPVIAPAGDEALVLWTDLTRTTTGELVAVRVDASGERLGDPRVLASEEWTSSRPAAVFTGQVWLVAWSVIRRVENTHRSDIYTMRVARDGTLLDAAPVPVDQGNWPVLASNGRVTVLAFGQSLIRYSPAGERIDDEPLSTIATGLHLSLGTNGREFLLTWTSGDDWWQFPAPNRYDVQAMRLDAGGAPMDAAPIDVAMGPDSALMARVTSDGTDFLVLYGEDTTLTTAETVRVKRVLRGGVLDGTTAAQEGILVADGSWPSAVASYRRGYVVTFATADGYTLSMVTLDRAGNPDSAPRVLATAETQFLDGSALASSGERVWLGYARPVPELDNVPRVFVRRVLESARRRAVR